MKQLYCPHKVTVSGILQYCNNGKSPVDCEHCDCPDKKEIEVTITTSSTSEYTPIQKKLMEISKPRSEEAIKRAEERKEKRKGKRVGMKEAEGNLKRLIDEMKSDAEVADDLGILPSEYRDLVTNALFEENQNQKL